MKKEIVQFRSSIEEREILIKNLKSECEHPFYVEINNHDEHRTNTYYRCGICEVNISHRDSSKPTIPESKWREIILSGSIEEFMIKNSKEYIELREKFIRAYSDWRMKLDPKLKKDSAVDLASWYIDVFENAIKMERKQALEYVSKQCDEMFQSLKFKKQDNSK
jgi:hypothetical protein